MTDEILGALQEAARGRVADQDEVLRRWAAALADPGTRTRACQLAPTVASLLRRRRQPAPARRVCADALELVTGATLVAMLRGEQLMAGLDEDDWIEPVPDVVRALLERADEAHAGGDLNRAGSLVAAALDVAFHRTVQAELRLSPAATRPDEVRGWLSWSSAYRELGRPISRRPTAVRGRRLLVVHNGNAHFVQGIADHLARGDTEVRWFDLAHPPEAFRRPTFPSLVTARLRAAHGAGKEVRTELGRGVEDLLDWADTVLVDWCDTAAIWASLAVSPGTRLVVRLHSIEAISAHPHVVDWGAVDDIIFVGAPLQSLTTAVVPGLQRKRPRQHLLPNECRLQRFGTDKNAEAARTLALVGWASIVKDPLWAFDVLRLLRADDPAWRLLLIGNDFPPQPLAGSRRYREELIQRAGEPDLAGAVDCIGYTQDLPTALRRVGFLLSTSRRESFHVGLIEGAASGAVPIVRDWPLLRAYGGARATVPPEWVVDTPEDAAERVRRFAEEPAWRAEGEEARRYVLANLDWSVVAERYEALLAPVPGPGRLATLTSRWSHVLPARRSN